MASMRKRYADRVEASPRHDGPPVTAPPTGAAKLPDPVVDAKPPEMPETTESPVDKAAKEAIALQLRLKEMERAEQLNREAVQQPPPHATEPQQQQPPAMPAHVEKWLADHPQYMDRNDAVAQAEIYTATLKCNRDGKSWDQPDFLPTLERHLGIAPRSNGHAQQHRIIERPPAPAAPRYEAPRQQRSAVPMSAPVSRDSPSLATGRPTGGPVRLTPAQQEAARFSGISEQEYARQLVKMERMKAAGELDDRGRR